MSRMAEQQLYINGGYTSATSGRTFETINPANGEVLASVQAAGREDVDRAVESAKRGQKIWAAMTAMERSRVLRRAVDILRERNDELAKLETLDTGKAYSETSTVDIVTGADVLEYYAGLIPALEGSQIPLRETSFVYTRREPLGVVAGIGAWVAPTVFTDCTDEMTIVREEIFGPVMSILTYETDEEAIRRANDTDYGLAAGIVTADLNRAHGTIHQLEAGICWINTWGESAAEMPVGGYKHSGIGRENGVMTLQSYTQVKSIQVEMGKFQSIF